MRFSRPLALLLCVAAPLGAQGQKKEITQDVYDAWRSIQGAALSPNGQWTVYTLAPVVGNGELIVRSTSGATEIRVPRGYVGRPAVTTAAGGFSAPAARISHDGRWVAALTYGTEAEFETARRTPRRNDEPKPSLAIVSLPDGQITRVERVRAFELPAKNGRWLAYQLEPADSASARQTADSAAAGVATPGAAAATPGGQARPIADSTRTRGPRRQPGSTLVLRDMTTGAETRVESVTGFTFDDAGRWLAYTVTAQAADSMRDGAYVRSLEQGREITLASGPGSYRQLSFDRDGQQVAFLTDRNTRNEKSPTHALYHATLRDGRAAVAVGPAALGPDERIADSRVAFTRNGAAITFGVQPTPPDSIPADSLYNKAVFDLWHWKDARLQTQQIVEAGRDRGRSATAIYHIRGKRYARLANDSIPNVSISDDGRVALGITSEPYRIESMWGDGGNDAYLIDANTGQARRIAERLSFGATLSPDAKYVVYFNEGNWFSHDVASNRLVNLTETVTRTGVRFDRETHDSPSTPPAWGVAGWTTGDRRMLVNDRYDVWEVDPTGREAPRVLTDSMGRRGNLVFRVVNLDREERALDPSQPLLLSAAHEFTKAAGFWTDRVGGNGAPQQIVMADVNYGTPMKATDADVFMVTRSTLADFPNLHVGSSLDRLTKITDANPQQGEYPWPSVELVSWMSADNIPLQGILFKPEGFDSSKQYPMVVYFYERLSDNLHNYVAPTGRNVINPVVYTSKGYLVFFPDIAYTEGYPGQSAFNSIVPGVQSIVQRGFVDPDGIGLGGQSWGGYQTAYLITRTNMFNAAFAGAPVANMTSAYGGIRWESGVARAFQYEKTQSRIGGSLWEYPWRYIENSPLFHADRIETPLFMMHNDADGAVPWYQGIEMFVAMRRLGKEVYMVNYNGDAHNPRKRANQKDVDLRMQQFFDHHLKGTPAPTWMTEGIPFLQKGRNAGTSAATAASPTTAAPVGGAPGGPGGN